MTDVLTQALTLAQDAPSSKSLLQYIAAGREIGFIIILLSLVGVGMIAAQLWRVRRSRLAPPEVVGQLHEKLRANDVKGAITICENPDNESFITRVFGAALVRCSRSPFGFLELRGALEESGQAEVARMYRMTDSIGLIASVAPMLGLLGTVVGMVGAFDTIAMSEGPARPDQLGGSISQALVTTVLGLIVAIPATAAYTYLRNRIDTLTSEVGETIEELAAYLESAATPSAPTQPAAPRPAPPPAPAAAPAPRGAPTP
ncbi:MAG: MotA/TolQ/ExbB proton channel family protein [Phycisphaerales bacterium]